MTNMQQDATNSQLERQLYKIIDSLKYMGVSNSFDCNLVSYLLVLKAIGVLGKINSKDETDVRNLLAIAAKEAEVNSSKLQIPNSIFLPILDVLSPSDAIAIINFINELEIDNYADASALFEKTEAYILAKEGKFGGTHALPVEVNKLIAALIPKEKGLSIYNPFAGTASLPIYLNRDCQYIGQEINKEAVAIGNLRFLVNNLGSNCDLYVGDSINNWIENTNGYDIVVSCPPFHLRLNNNFEFPMDSRIKEAEQFYLIKAYQSIKSDGKVIAILPSSFFFLSGFDKDIRRNFIENNHIETIISLPGGIISNTAVESSIVVINKNNYNKDQVFAVDATNLVEYKGKNSKILLYKQILTIVDAQQTTDYSKFISNDSIIKNDYNLVVRRYLLKSDSNAPQIAIREYAEVVSGPREYLHVGKVLRIRDLKDDKIDHKLNLDLLDNEMTPKNVYKVSESAIFVALKGNRLKPTYFTYTNEPIWVSTDILAIKLDETRINVEYFINVLFSKWIEMQLDSFRNRSIILSLSKKDFLDLTIEIPPVPSIQELIVLELKEALWEEKLKEAERIKKEHGLEDKLLEQNRYLRHSLAGPAKNLRGSIENLKKIISEQILPTIPNVMDLTPSKTVARTLGNYLDMISRDINKISDAVARKTASDEYLINAPLKPINIFDFLSNYISEKKDQVGLNYEIELVINGIPLEPSEEETDKTGGLFVNANEDLLGQLFDNLIENSVQHAFSGNQKNQILIMLSPSYQNLIIDYSNNGTSMPSDIKLPDFIRKGATFGKNGGDGYGGWLINEIIGKFGGTFDITETNDFPQGTFLGTNFEISLPIVNPE